MNWLDAKENEYQQRENDAESFRKAVSIAESVVQRMKKFCVLLTSKKLAYSYTVEASENGGVIAERERSYNEEYITSYKRRLLLINKSGTNSIELIREKRPSRRIYDNYDNDPHFYDETKIGKYPTTVLKCELSNDQLTKLTEDNWVNILGWVVEKTSLETVKLNTGASCTIYPDYSSIKPLQSSKKKTRDRASIIFYSVAGVVCLLLFIWGYNMLHDSGQPGMKLDSTFEEHGRSIFGVLLGLGLMIVGGGGVFITIREILHEW